MSVFVGLLDFSWPGQTSIKEQQKVTKAKQEGMGPTWWVTPSAGANFHPCDVYCIPKRPVHGDRTYTAWGNQICSSQVRKAADEGYPCPCQWKMLRGNWRTWCVIMFNSINLQLTKHSIQDPDGFLFCPAFMNQCTIYMRKDLSHKAVSWVSYWEEHQTWSVMLEK